jgi:DNA-binding response OmpR family regulator
MAVKRRILIVDDDDPARDALAQQLATHEDYEVVQVKTAAAALDFTRYTTFDAILLEIALSDMDGRELCRILRRNGVASPMIVLTASTSDADAILSLDAGANDFVAKPYRLGVLLARIRAQLRQYQSSTDAVFIVGPYLYRPGNRSLLERAGGKEIALSDTENAILRHLYSAGNTAVTRRELYERVWGFSTAIDTHTLQTHIYRLRRKIEADPSNPTLLISENQGYRLVR